MNFQQLRAVHEAIRRNFNLTETAEALHASQSAVSRQIRELEDELGVSIFQRHGKRLIRLTEPGLEIARIIERILKDRTSLKKASDEFRHNDGGNLVLAATNAQVRYRLPDAIMAFRDAYPQVHLSLYQTFPAQIIELVRSGRVDLGLLPEVLTQAGDLIIFKAYSWSHRFVVRKGHPLLDVPHPSLRDIAEHPLISFEDGMTGKSNIDAAFRNAGIEPNVIISAIDSDVIKTFVTLGMGVGIISEKSFDPLLDQHLVCLDTPSLIEPVHACIAIRRGTYLRSYALSFIQSIIPGLTPQIILEHLQAPHDATFSVA